MHRWRFLYVCFVPFIIMLATIGCDRQAKIPKSPVFEGRAGQVLSDGTVGVKAIEFYESFGAPVGGPFGFGGGGVSLAMKYRLMNFGSSPLRFDKIGVEFQTSTLGKKNEYFPSAHTMTVITEKGYRVYYGGHFGEKPNLPTGIDEPFVIPPSHSLELEISGEGTPLQLVVDDSGARRDYKIIITLYASDTISHGPFTINVTALEGKDKTKFKFE